MLIGSWTGASLTFVSWFMFRYGIPDDYKCILGVRFYLWRLCGTGTCQGGWGPRILLIVAWPSWCLGWRSHTTVSRILNGSPEGTTKLYQQTDCQCWRRRLMDVTELYDLRGFHGVR
ncbi:hypothetical protein EV702DRAFT_1059571, partial [Suillus placidus]